jgi:hypothetical protein
MEKIDKSQIQGFLIGQLIITFIGGLLLITSDFAGFYHYDYYNKIEKWGSVYLGSGFISSLLIVVTAIGLFLSAWYSFQIMRNDSFTTEKILTLEANAEKILLVSMSITVAGGLIFAASEIISQTQEWWFDAGFYGALVGSMIGMVFAKQISAKVRSTLQQGQNTNQ